MPALPPHHRQNFRTLSKAFDNGDVCILDCFEKATRRPVAIICTVHKEGDEFVMTPFAKMLDPETVFDDYIPPDPNSKGYSPDNVKE